ncbi:unnamed protein product [Mytilus coruscus]|uniref:Uncharacterized protein n=1 Tax=Mytilus coruscus TaxID=42192 RepID=A0A6J8CI25_MYTCO|nr:unnamed protein product [Mytilus coruscus]
MRRFVPKDQIRTFIEQKRRRVAEWVKQVATGQKGLNFPGEVKQTGQRTARSAKVANSAPVTNSAQKKGSTAKSALVANLAPVTNSAQKKGSTARSKKGKETIRYRPHVKCKICNTYQKNIWRHMRLMHDSGKDIKEETKVVSKSGYVIRICPINNCGMIVERMKDHLVRTHKIKRHTKNLERLMKKAEPLTEINKSQDTTSDLIEISSDDECLNVKPIKIEPNDGDSGSNYESGESVEPIKKEMIEFESDFNDYEKYKEQDKDSINSLGFQQTDMKYMDSDSNMSNNERNSTGQTNSVHSLGFVYESPGSIIEVSDMEQEKNTENSPTKRYINKIKHTKEIYSRSQKSQVLKDFAKYLVEAPNLKTNKIVRQHQHQVCELWLYITPKMTIKDLSSISKLNEWTGKKLATLAPGTIRSYLSSMGLFVDFLMETGLAKHVERFQRFRESLKTIAKKLKRRAKMRRTVVETEEIGYIVANQDVPSNIKQYSEKKIENLNKSVKSQDECEVYKKKKAHGRRSFEAAESSDLIELCNDLIQKGNIKKAEVEGGQEKNFKPLLRRAASACEIFLTQVEGGQEKILSLCFGEPHRPVKFSDPGRRRTKKNFKPLLRRAASACEIFLPSKGGLVECGPAATCPISQSVGKGDIVAARPTPPAYGQPRQSGYETLVQRRRQKSVARY